MLQFSTLPSHGIRSGSLLPQLLGEPEENSFGTPEVADPIHFPAARRPQDWCPTPQFTGRLLTLRRNWLFGGRWQSTPLVNPIVRRTAPHRKVSRTPFGRDGRSSQPSFQAAARRQGPRLRRGGCHC